MLIDALIISIQIRLQMASNTLNAPWEFAESYHTRITVKTLESSIWGVTVEVLVQMIFLVSDAPRIPGYVI